MGSWRGGGRGSGGQFVSGPVFDDSSNERGLVRVCGYLGAVLCGAIGVRRLLNVPKFEF